MIKPNLTIIAWVVIAVLVTVLCFTLFRKSIPNAEVAVLKEQAKHKEEMRLKDSVYFTRRIESKDSIIDVLKGMASQKQVQYIQLKNDEKNIRPTVESYSNNELLRRANGWKPE